MPDPIFVDAAVAVFESATRTASPPDFFVNKPGVGLHLIINVTAAPGSGQTLTPTLLGVERFGEAYPLLVGSPITATGVYVLKIGPGLPSIPNVSANDRLPSVWGVDMAHSGGGAWTYSVSANVNNG